MKLHLDLQQASASSRVPEAAAFTRWAKAALRGRRVRADLSLRVIDEAESAALNQRFRGKTGPTNVLSFPFSPLPGLPALEILGDLALCAPVVEREAAEQGKRLEAHWAHMVVHGTLHLLGHDHGDARQAAEMEAIEADILATLGFPHPYESGFSDPAGPSPSGSNT